MENSKMIEKIEVDMKMCTQTSHQRRKSKYSGSLEKGFLESLIRDSSPRIGLLSVQGKSHVWSVFKRILLDEEETRYVQCQECGNVMIHDNSTGTGGLKRHHCTPKVPTTNSSGLNNSLSKVDNRGAEFYSESNLDPSLPLTQMNYDSYKPTPSTSSNQTESLLINLNREVAKAGALAVIKDYRPLSFIEGSGFEILAQSLINIGAKHGNVEAKQLLPSSSEVARNLDEIYAKIREVVRNELKNIKSMGAFCENFRCDNDTTYCIVSVRHFMHSQLVTRTLGAFRIDDTTSIVDEVNKLFNEFCLAQKVKICVTSNPCALIRSPDLQYPWVSCAVNNINLALKNALNRSDDPLIGRVNDLIKKCEILVNYWKTNRYDTSLNVKLEETSDNKYCIMVDMLESIENNWMQLMMARNINHELKDSIDCLDKDLISNLKNVLMPFKELREALSNPNEPTFHLVLPAKAKLLKKCDGFSNDDEIIMRIKESLRDKIETYFEVSIFHKCATILVPSFRSLKNMANIYEREEIFKTVKKLEEWYREMPSKEIDNKSSLEGIYDPLVDPVSFSNSEEHHEIGRYLKDVFSSSELKASPMEFWESKKTVYPCLYEVAKWLLSTPASSASTINNYLNSVESINVEKFSEIVFIRTNLEVS